MQEEIEKQIKDLLENMDNHMTSNSLAEYAQAVESLTRSLTNLKQMEEGK